MEKKGLASISERTHLGEQLSRADDAVIFEELDLASKAVAGFARLFGPLENLDVAAQLVHLVLDIRKQPDRAPLFELFAEHARDVFALLVRDREEGDVVFREFALDIRHLAELKVDTARTAIVCLIVAGGEDVQSEEGHAEVLRNGGRVRKRSVVDSAEVLVPVCRQSKSWSELGQRRERRTQPEQTSANTPRCPPCSACRPV